MNADPGLWLWMGRSTAHYVADVTPDEVRTSTLQPILDNRVLRSACGFESIIWGPPDESMPRCGRCARTAPAG